MGADRGFDAGDSVAEFILNNYVKAIRDAWWERGGLKKGSNVFWNKKKKILTYVLFCLDLALTKIHLMDDQRRELPNTDRCKHSLNITKIVSDCMMLILTGVLKKNPVGNVPV